MQLIQQTEEIDVRRAELDSQCRQLDEQRQQWQAEREESERQLKQRSEELDVRRSELDAKRREFDAQRQQWQAEREEQERQLAERLEQSQEAKPEEPANEAPVDLESVLRRMGSAGSLREGESEEELPTSAEPEPEPPRETMAVEPLTPSPPAENREDESIDTYMARLMDRVRATSGEAASGACQPETARPRQPATSAPRTENETAETDEPPVPPPAVSRQRKAVELSPRAVAPEKHAGLSAMRELANISAKTAISRHARRKTTLARRSNLLVAIVGLLAGWMLAWIWWATDTGTLVFYSALVSFFVVLVWGVRYAVLTGHPTTGKSGPPGRTSSGGEEEESETG